MIQLKSGKTLRVKDLTLGDLVQIKNVVLDRAIPSISGLPTGDNKVALLSVLRALTEDDILKIAGIATGETPDSLRENGLTLATILQIFTEITQQTGLLDLGGTLGGESEAHA